MICKYLFCHSDRSMEILKLCSLQILKDICKVLNMIFLLFSKLSGDALHGNRSGEADEDAEALRRKNSIFGLPDA